jgi:hypothetical protein
VRVGSWVHIGPMDALFWPSIGRRGRDVPAEAASSCTGRRGPTQYEGRVVGGTQCKTCL